VKNPAALGAPELFDVRLTSAAENLACDEALLDECEATERPGFIRFWESPAHFVVLGYGKALEKEVFRRECASLGIPILRRCSGGGTVLQGPGCFNYTLVLPIESALELGTISGANCFIMQRMKKAVEKVAHGSIEVRGFTDLVVNGRKFSGNAQRRKRRCLLFHGAFLIDFDLDLITRALRLPAQQPEYRAHRSHAEFLTNLPLDRARLSAAIQQEWNIAESAGAAVREEILGRTRNLGSSKYSSMEWIDRS
jgi:lipoate-protein ligase A